MQVLGRGQIGGKVCYGCIAVLCRRCDWSKLNQCIDFFQKQGAIRGPNEMDKDFQKLDVETETAVSDES